MVKTLQRSISKMALGAVSVALTLVVMLANRWFDPRRAGQLLRNRIRGWRLLVRNAVEAGSLVREPS